MCHMVATVNHVEHNLDGLAHQSPYGKIPFTSNLPFVREKFQGKETSCFDV